MSSLQKIHLLFTNLTIQAGPSTTGLPLVSAGHRSQLLHNNTVDDELQRLKEDTSTYTTPIVMEATNEAVVDHSHSDEQQEAQAFLQSFDVIAKTDEIITILQQQEAVRLQFEALVPLHVSYEHFWARFFFRCRDRLRAEIEEAYTNNETSTCCDTTKSTTTTKTTTTTTWTIPNPLDVVMGKFDASSEAEFRKGLEEVYTTKLLCELPNVGGDNDSNNWEVMYELEATRNFLDTFDIHGKTDEIATILEKNPNTVKFYFEALVPVDVAYGEFWARYFFRCDEQIIERAWIDYQYHWKQERLRTIRAVQSTVKQMSTNVIVYPIKTVWTTSFNLGSMIVNTALLPVGAITNAASVIVNSAGRLASTATPSETTPETETLASERHEQEPQNKQRVKHLQKKLVEAKRELRRSKADASRLRNQLMKAHDALRNEAPTAISFAENKHRSAMILEDNTSSSAITEESLCGIDDEWSASADGLLLMDKDSSSTSATVLDDSLSSVVDTFLSPSATIFRQLATNNE